MGQAAWATFPAETKPPAGVLDLAGQVETDGGSALALYQEPVGKGWQIFALLPLEQVEPTPYQRDLSKTHADRLREIIKKLDRFVDPVVAVRVGAKKYWTPNGNHRRAALEKLKAKFIPVILIPEVEVAFQILALNTEKAHNLKEKSLEVIRMYRGLMEAEGGKSEESFAFQFEQPHFITLGLLYEKHPRFAGGAFAPILKRVDKFLKDSLVKSYRQRQERADLVDAASEVLDEVVAKIKKRGINHPYVKNFVLARCNPLTRARKTVPTFEQTFTKLTDALQKFDPGKLRMEDIARAAVMAGE
ncbi:MAG: ParB N-terminal domain-containing protein [Candidatus Tectomicrobia bacterium]|uniref:ParB N-terminal domain-containing protein n=1 Tax=Tectimicrobiota bacterium TaxID=2528274 RepID=A0A932M0W6_UNCTE|nr:ParB N-terminal domain-containing protein [Candidatus Tectomicrobia bacterium]